MNITQIKQLLNSSYKALIIEIKDNFEAIPHDVDSFDIFDKLNINLDVFNDLIAEQNPSDLAYIACLDKLRDIQLSRLFIAPCVFFEDVPSEHYLIKYKYYPYPETNLSNNQSCAKHLGISQIQAFESFISVKDNKFCESIRISDCSGYVERTSSRNFDDLSNFHFENIISEKKSLHMKQHVSKDDIMLIAKLFVELSKCTNPITYSKFKARLSKCIDLIITEKSITTTPPVHELI